MMISGAYYLNFLIRGIGKNSFKKRFKLLNTYSTLSRRDHLIFYIALYGCAKKSPTILLNWSFLSIGVAWPLAGIIHK